MLSTPNVSPRSFSKWRILLHKFFHAWFWVQTIIVKMYSKELSLIAFPNVQTDVILVHSSYLFSSRDRRTFFCSLERILWDLCAKETKWTKIKFLVGTDAKKLEIVAASATKLKLKVHSKRFVEQRCVSIITYDTRHRLTKIIPQSLQ